MKLENFKLKFETVAEGYFFCHTLCVCICYCMLNAGLMRVFCATVSTDCRVHCTFQYHCYYVTVFC